MNLPIQLFTGRRGEESFHLFFVAKRFQEGLTVTGYLIYPNLSKSDVVNFVELGDGIYVGEFPFSKKTPFSEKVWSVNQGEWDTGPFWNHIHDEFWIG